MLRVRNKITLQRSNRTCCVNKMKMQFGKMIKIELVLFLWIRKKILFRYVLILIERRDVFNLFSDTLTRQFLSVFSLNYLTLKWFSLKQIYCMYINYLHKLQYKHVQ